MVRLIDARGDIDAVAMAAALAYERERGWTSTDESSGSHSVEAREAVRLRAPELRSFSFDIFSVAPDTTVVRFIEVKGRSRSGPVEIIEKERVTGIALSDDYWLYVVFDCRSAPRVLPIPNPMRLQWEAYPGNQYATSSRQHRYMLSSEQIERAATAE